VVAWIMLRKPAAASTPSAQTAMTAAPVAAPPPASSPQQGPPPAAAPSQAFAQNAAGSVQPQPNVPPPSYNNGANPNNANPNTRYAPSGGNGYVPPAANNGNAPPNYQGAPGRAPGQESNYADQEATPFQESTNPDDYAPAREPPPPGTGAGRLIHSATSGLPSYAEAATQTSIPSLHMDLHSYAPDPTKRFVLINMKRLYEGQALPEGPKVESITRDGAIMTYNGKRFMLDRNN
jgi:hypothetical protein